MKTGFVKSVGIEHMKFRGCKYLDFDDNYVGCKKVNINGEHICWERDAEIYGYENTLVQFCKRRGRLNYPYACIGQSNAMCSDYEETEFNVEPE